jgi:hypothetical protein
MRDRRGKAPYCGRRVRLLAIATAIVIYPVLSGFDLSHHVVPPSEIRDGGPAKDAIPAVLEPQFVKPTDATFLESNDKVIGVVVEGRARAYPIKILNWHEVVDDSIAGTPLAVTFCPLVQGAAVYIREAGGKTLILGVSGKRVPVYNGYWFAWAAFHPKTRIWSPAATAAKTTNNTAPAAGQ